MVKPCRMIGLAWVLLLCATMSAGNFETAEKRAIDCCASLPNVSVALNCSRVSLTTSLNATIQIYTDLGLTDVNGMSGAQRSRVKPLLSRGLPYYRTTIMATNECISKWMDYTSCCRAANVSNACLYLCNPRKMKESLEKNDVNSLVDRLADEFGLCNPHMVAVHTCSFAE